MATIEKDIAMITKAIQYIVDGTYCGRQRYEDALSHPRSLV
jgi:hypothetical protein